MSTLSVVVLSYNRPQELARCLRTLLPLPEGVTVRIVDDCSPKRAEIEASISQIITENPQIIFHSNASNVGYDQNLFNGVVETSDDYVLLLSDDDGLEPGALAHIMQFISMRAPKVGFVRYTFYGEHNASQGIKRKRSYEEDLYFPSATVCSDGAYLYNSILFSGLLFQSSAVRNIRGAIERYTSSIYIQVAIFCLLSQSFGGWYIDGPGVLVYGDGVSGFGKNTAGQADAELIDRSNIVTNLAYNKRLIRVVENLGVSLGRGFVEAFFREFNFRNVLGMWRARKSLGRAGLRSYWELFSSITRYRPTYFQLIYWCLWISPSWLMSKVMFVAEAGVLHYRRMSSS